MNKIEAMLPLRLSELQEIGILGVPVNQGELIELTNLTERNIEYIKNTPYYGFQIKDGKYYLQTIFPDRPIGHTCKGLSFQQLYGDISFITDEDSKAEYLKLDCIYWGISPVDKIEIKDKITKVLNEFNYQNIEQVEQSINSGNFEFVRALYAEFGMCDKKPQLVEKYAEDEGIVIYSGTRDVNDKIERLKNGEYPFTDQSTFGFGYYFSDDLHTPIRYANKVKENIIEARINPNARILTGKQLERILPMLFDNMPQKSSWDLVSKVLQIPELCTLATTVLQHDCLQVSSNYKVGETYYIPTNLEMVTMSNDPLYVNNIEADSNM